MDDSSTVSLHGVVGSQVRHRDERVEGTVVGWRVPSKGGIYLIVKVKIGSDVVLREWMFEHVTVRT